MPRGLYSGDHLNDKNQQAKRPYILVCKVFIICWSNEHEEKRSVSLRALRFLNVRRIARVKRSNPYRSRILQSELLHIPVIFDLLDLGSKFTELDLKVFIASLNILDIFYCREAFCSKSSDNQCSTCS